MWLIDENIYKDLNISRCCTNWIEEEVSGFIGTSLQFGVMREYAEVVNRYNCFHNHSTILI